MPKRAKGKKEGAAESKLFRGVRMRKWGRWVSEIRIPKSRSRIWLGSYDTPDKAARAYDAAVYCLRGPKGKFNFPDGKRPEMNEEERKGLTDEQVKGIAMKIAVMSLPVTAAEPAAAACAASSDDHMTMNTAACAALDLEFAIDVDLLFEDKDFLEETMRSLWDLM